jgi:hypothetical protein
MLEPWIETYCGIKFYFLNPTPEMVNIKDIAHSLSLQCRFSGHTNRFYSVAEHSVRVSRFLFSTYGDYRLALQGLLHDASEAYLLDVPSPVKQHLGGYKSMEDKLQEVILNKYHAGWPMDARTKDADAILLKNEARYLLPSKGRSWVDHYPTTEEFGMEPMCDAPTVAEETFLAWFFFLEKYVEAQRLTIAA